MFLNTRPVLSDTTLEAEQVQLQLLRDKSPAERARLALQLSGEMILASKRAIARAHPQWSPRLVDHQFIALHYGSDLADAVIEHDRMRDGGQTG